MARSDLAVVDEEGDLYPPGLALVAFLRDFGGDAEFDGVLVEVSAYPVMDDFFEVVPVWRLREGSYPGEVFYALPRELVPANEHTRKYIEELSNTGVEIYSMEVYDLRDALDALGIAVTAESVSAWTAEQQEGVWAYLTALEKMVFNPRLDEPPLPEVLK